MMKFSHCVMLDKRLPDVIAHVGKAEELGIDHVWIPDENFMPDPYTALGALGVSTERIGLGVGIANPYTRHPMQIARAVATLSDAADRPIVLGIGAGLKPARVAIGAPEGDFVSITRDAITAMKALWAGERVTMKNDVFELNNARMEFAPKHPIRIFIASTHPKAFRMAGEAADGVIVGNVGMPDAMKQVEAWISEGAEAAGRSRKDIEIVAWNMALCGYDSATMYDTIRSITAKTIANSHSRISGLLGLDKDFVETVRTTSRGGQTDKVAELVTNEVIDRFAFVGSAADCAARMQALHRAGADTVAIRPCLDIVHALDYEKMVFELYAALRAA